LPQKAVVELYRSADLFLSASTRAEGFGRPAIEAAATGPPSVLPAIPSFLAIPGLDRCALFYPPGNARAAAERVGKLLDDPALMSTLSAAGPHVAGQFSPLQVAERVVTALGAAAARAPAATRRSASAPGATTPSSPLWPRTLAPTMAAEWMISRGESPCQARGRAPVRHQS
jgi:Glycosyl transferases group 1